MIQFDIALVAPAPGAAALRDQGDFRDGASDAPTFQHYLNSADRGNVDTEDRGRESSEPFDPRCSAPAGESSVRSTSESAAPAAADLDPPSTESEETAVSEEADASPVLQRDPTASSVDHSAVQDNATIPPVEPVSADGETDAVGGASPKNFAVSRRTAVRQPGAGAQQVAGPANAVSADALVEAPDGAPAALDVDRAGAAPQHAHLPEEQSPATDGLALLKPRVLGPIELPTPTTGAHSGAATVAILTEEPAGQSLRETLSNETSPSGTRPSTRSRVDSRRTSVHPAGPPDSDAQGAATRDANAALSGQANTAGNELPGSTSATAVQAISDLETTMAKGTVASQQYSSSKQGLTPPSLSQPPDASLERDGMADKTGTMQPLDSNAEPSANGADRMRFVQRVMHALQAAEARGTPVRLRLSPPELGSLRLELEVRDGALAARLEVETANARALLLDSLPQLRERLASQEIKIERFEVDLMNHHAGDWSHGPRERQHDGNARSYHLGTDDIAMPEEALSAVATVQRLDERGINVLV
jgi:flagellar hook-length control protein FliK